MSYKYKDIPLTPSIAKEIMVENFTSHVRYENKEIREKVLEIHLENGGKIHRGKDLWRNVLKCALGQLKKDGKVNNPVRGFWEFTFSKDEKKDDVKIKAITNSQVEEKVSPTLKEKPEYASTGIQPKFIIGNKNNKGFVYLYYFPNYKDNGNKAWPCKIGASKNNDYSRIYTQVGTAMPEEPILEMVIFHNDYKDLEKLIHFYFKIRNKHKKDARGNEWFIVNPDEIFNFLVVNKVINYTDIVKKN